MQRIPDVGYLLTNKDNRELLPGSEHMTCFSEASNVAVDEARATNREVHVVAVSLKGTKKLIEARRGARNWRPARVITLAMIRARREWEGIL